MATTEKNGVDHGTALITWKFPEIPKYHYSRTWYIVMSIIGTAFLTFAILSNNPLFAFIVVIAWALFFYRSRQKPSMLTTTIYEDGVGVGKDFYSYDDLKEFWIIYKPPAKTLYLSFRTSMRPIFSIALEDTNPVEVRKQLKRFIPEDLSKEDESASDAFGRLFRI